MESILTSIKKLMGITEECVDFDVDMLIHINTAFTNLTQLGVGPEEGFSITDKNAVWDDFITDKRLESVKTYVYLKVRLIFDPPSSSAVLEAIERTIKETEWRLNHAAELIKSE